MKKIITLITAIAIATILLPSCKKSDTQMPQTTLQKIQNKWSLESYLENDHYSGSDHIKNTPGTANDYVDFRIDGKVYTSFLGFKDTVIYSLVNDTQLLINGSRKYDIRVLTSNAFTIYGKELYPGGSFLEETITMKK